MHITPNTQDRLVIASILIFGIILITVFSVTIYEYNLEQKEFDPRLGANLGLQAEV